MMMFTMTLRDQLLIHENRDSSWIVVINRGAWVAAVGKGSMEAWEAKEPLVFKELKRLQGDAARHGVREENVRVVGTPEPLKLVSSWTHNTRVEEIEPSPLTGLLPEIWRTEYDDFLLE